MLAPIVEYVDLRFIVLMKLEIFTAMNISGTLFLFRLLSIFDKSMSDKSWGYDFGSKYYIIGPIAASVICVITSAITTQVRPKI